MAYDVPYPVTYDGTPLVTDANGQHRLVFWLARGLDESTEVRGVDTIIPGLAGRTHRTRVRDYRTIEVQGMVLGTGATDALQRADLRNAMNTLRSLFDPTRAPAVLSVTLETGTATISARPVNMVVSDIPDPVVRVVSIELEAVGADWSIA